MNINNLLDIWEDPLIYLYQKEKDILNNGIELMIPKDITSIENIFKSIFYIEKTRFSRRRYSEILLSTNLNIYNDEIIKLKTNSHIVEFLAISNSNLIKKTIDFLIDKKNINQKKFKIQIEFSHKRKYSENMLFNPPHNILWVTLNQTQEKDSDIYSKLIEEKNIHYIELLYNRYKLKSENKVNNGEYETFSQKEKIELLADFDSFLKTYTKDLKTKEDYLNSFIK